MGQLFEFEQHYLLLIQYIIRNIFKSKNTSKTFLHSKKLIESLQFAIKCNIFYNNLNCSHA